MAPFLSVVQQQPTQQLGSLRDYHPFVATILHSIMKFTTVFVASTATLASARPQYDAAPADPHAWMAASPNDCMYTCSYVERRSNADIRSPRPLPDA